MDNRNYGKKAAGILLHVMCMALMICSVFAMDYFHKNRQWQMSGNSGFFTVVGLVGSFVSLAYLTNISGRRSEEDPKIYYNFFDRIPSDLLMVLFIFYLLIVWRMETSVRHQEYSLAGLLVLAGSFTCVLDLLFLAFYLSIMRRLKGNRLPKDSLSYRIFCYFRELTRTGQPLLCTQKGKERREIRDAVEAIAAGALDTRLDVEHFHGQEMEIAVAVNHIRDGLQQAVQESIRNERMKADLITNVSHDIKTPLTSIVNYAGLLERENLDNPVAGKYVRIINEKSQRLRQLTEDLVEVSRISSGNIKLDMQSIDFVELLYQTGGEFNERFEARELTIVTKLPQGPVMITADGRQLYRAVENLYTNAAKYALAKSRVHVDLRAEAGRAVFVMKNVVGEPIQVRQDNYDELTERFVRGESSRTMEGSGLGLSIAKNLTLLMGGSFDVRVEDDVFIAAISFPLLA